MNPIRISYNVTALLALVGLSACSVALAQTTKERPKNCVAYQEELNYATRISGQHLERIKSVTIHFDRSSTGQEPTKLRTWYEIGITHRADDAPGLFRVSFSVPGEIASGDYTLSLMSINGDGATQSVQGPDLPNARFKVCSAEEFGPFKVDSFEGGH